MNLGFEWGAADTSTCANTIACYVYVVKFVGKSGLPDQATRKELEPKKQRIYPGVKFH